MLRPRAEIRLIGRESESAALSGALDRVREGGSATVIISGEAGVGKSRLIAEFTKDAQREGIPVFTGRCVDTRMALPCLPFTEILTQAAAGGRELGADAPLRALMTGECFDEAVGGAHALSRTRVFSAALAAVRSLGRGGPAVLVLEDIHWADRSSLDMLLFLAVRLHDDVLVVASHRSDDLRRGHPLRQVLAELCRLPRVERLVLAPLGEEDSRRLVSELAALLPEHAAPPPAELERIARRCDGNPFFAEELTAAGSAALPGGLFELLVARAERLAEPTRRLLGAAAVVARPVSADRLRTLSELTPAQLDDAVRQALDHGVLVTEPAPAPGAERYRFRYTLLRESVYRDTPPGLRARLHADCTRLLLQDTGGRGAVAELAFHALAAQDLPLALSASVRASRDAAKRGASHEALAHGECALALWASVPDADTVAGANEVVVTRLAAMGAGDSGHLERALALQHRAVELADARGDHGLAAATRIRYALRLLELPAREPDAVRQAEIALGLLSPGPPSSDKAWSHAVLARALTRLGRFEEGRGHAELGEKTARAAGAEAALTEDVDPFGTECDALGAETDSRITTAFAELRQYGPAHARETFTETKRPGRLSGHFGVELRAHYGLGLCHLSAGELVRAVDEFAAGGERAECTGTTWSEYGLGLRIARAVTLFRLGEWDAADRALRPESQLASPLLTDHCAAARRMIAAARYPSGARDAAFGCVPSASRTALLVAQARAETALWEKQPRRAADHVAHALGELRTAQALPGDEAGRTDEELALCALGMTAYADLADTGALPRAKAADASHDVLSHAHGAARTWDVTAQAWLAWIDAEHHRARGAATADLWAEVVTAFGYGDVYRQALAHWRRAEVLLLSRAGSAPRGSHQARRTRAADDLARAAEIAKALGAAPLLAAVADLAERAGARRTGADGEGGPLTGRERSVLGLVAQGLTNRQIGLQLFISEKTVSVHLTRIMDKLGAHSRTEAVNVAHRRRLLD